MLFVHGWQSTNKQFKENRMYGLAVQRKNNIYKADLMRIKYRVKSNSGTAYYEIVIFRKFS
jgi:hypothetical protein